MNLICQSGMPVHTVPTLRSVLSDEVAQEVAFAKRVRIPIEAEDHPICLSPGNRNPSVKLRSASDHRKFSVLHPSTHVTDFHWRHQKVFLIHGPFYLALVPQLESLHLDATEGLVEDQAASDPGRYDRLELLKVKLKITSCMLVPYAG
jgi:hypothetical protein